MDPTTPSPPTAKQDRPHPAHTARVIAAVISMGTFGVIVGALAANASADDNTKVATDQQTTSTIVTSPTVPGDGTQGGDDGYSYGEGDDDDDGYSSDDDTVTEQGPWGAQPGVPPSGGIPQQGPSTQSNGS